jgi:hypothetical protein
LGGLVKTFDQIEYFGNLKLAKALFVDLATRHTDHNLLEMEHELGCRIHCLPTNLLHLSFQLPKGVFDQL